MGSQNIYVVKTVSAGDGQANRQSRGQRVDDGQEQRAKPRRDEGQRRTITSDRPDAVAGSGYWPELYLPAPASSARDDFTLRAGR